MDGYRFVYRGGSGEIVEKKSRFIAAVEPVDTPEAAMEFVAKKKKEYWDARHNCYAYVVGEHQEQMRCSDDGEPAGTAGRPILDVLLKEDIHNAVVVVTRYFGGVLLGTGGLVRAYQKAAAEGLADAEVLVSRKGCPLYVAADYSDYGKVEYVLREQEVSVEDISYGAEVELWAVVPADRKEKVEKEIREKTAAKARIRWDSEVDFAVDEAGKIILKKST